MSSCIDYLVSFLCPLKSYLPVTYLPVYMCATTCIETSVDNLQDSALPFHPVGSRDPIEIVQLGRQYLDALSWFL